MNFSELYNIVTKLPYDEELRLSYFSLESLREELRLMCHHEYRKEPQHPHFQPYYLDKIFSAGYSKVNFDFKVFLEYMFTPYVLQTGGTHILVIVDGPMFIFKKQYRGCEHIFNTDKTLYTNWEGKQIELDIMIVCSKCGYKQNKVDL